MQVAAYIPIYLSFSCPWATVSNIPPVRFVEDILRRKLDVWGRCWRSPERQRWIKEGRVVRRNRVQWYSIPRRRHWSPYRRHLLVSSTWYSGELHACVLCLNRALPVLFTGQVYMYMNKRHSYRSETRSPGICCAYMWTLSWDRKIDRFWRKIDFGVLWAMFEILGGAKYVLYTITVMSP